MNNKDKIDTLHKIIDSSHKQSDIIYKKLFVLISICAGITTVFFKIELGGYWLIFVSIIFLLTILGAFINYIRLSILYKEIEIIKNQIKGLKDE